MLEHFTFQSYTNAVHYGSSKTFKFVTEARMLTTLDIVKDIDIQNRIWVAYKQGPFAMVNLFSGSSTDMVPHSQLAILTISTRVAYHPTLPRHYPSGIETAELHTLTG
jgi:hypothetical protein